MCGIFGIKPFYYWFDGKTFAFASEIKTLLTLLFVTRRIKEDLLLDLVVFHMHHHTNDTICDGIHQVPPSHNLTLTLPDMTLSTERYYSLPLNKEVSTYDHRQALRHADNIRELLPERILWRKDKIGFTTPSAKWSTCENSPILPLIKRYGIKEYSTHYLWKFYIAHRLINLK